MPFETKETDPVARLAGSRGRVGLWCAWLYGPGPESRATAGLVADGHRWYRRSPA